MVYEYISLTWSVSILRKRRLDVARVASGNDSAVVPKHPLESFEERLLFHIIDSHRKSASLGMIAAVFVMATRWPHHSQVSFGDNCGIRVCSISEFP